MRRRTALLIAAVLLAPFAPRATAAPAPKYDVTIRMTEAGIPHIEARDWGSMGFGYAHALAQETLCTLADTYTTVRGQRSRYFGPTATYVFRGNGYTVTNLSSDFFFQQIIDDKRIEKLLAQKAPLGPKTEVRQAVKGYVDGYNDYLRSIGGSNGVSDPTCRGKAWVTPITEIDAYRRFYQLALLASSGVAINGIGEATPPVPGAPSPKVKTAEIASAIDREIKGLAIGSNAVALGSAATANGHGLLLGNPHFPWLGSERFYQAQLTIPGKLDVTGGALLGVPVVLIGHTAHVAWSHTVSTAYRFTPFQETLVPGSPTTYLYDGKPRAMSARTVSVKALVNGRLETRTKTLYSTIHGSVFTNLVGIPLPWTPALAFTLGDANAPNFRYLNHFFEVDQAQSVADVLSVLKRNQGVPWVNTLASDDAGNALYADISVTPHVTDTQARTCASPLGLATFALLGLPVLDGSRSACEWGSDPDSLQKGTFGPSHMPVLVRKDYVTNSNDSYWLSNPNAPLEGFNRIIGQERSERTTRTRSGLVMVAQQLAKGKFTRQVLQDLLFSDRQYSGELTRDDVVAMCRAFPLGMAPSASGLVPVGKACDVLARWDVRDQLASRGSLLFRRFWTHAISVPVSAAAASTQQLPIWKVPFSAADPVNTPRSLNTANPLVQKAFGDALLDLAGAGIAVDAPLGQYQADLRPDGTRTALQGGPGTLGVFNALAVAWNPAKGYVGPLAHGSSFIQVVQFNGTGCPDARTILTYSQSTNPRSPHFSDQTKLFGKGQWLTDHFCRADVLKHTLSTVRLRA